LREFYVTSRERVETIARAWEPYHATYCTRGEDRYEGWYALVCGGHQKRRYCDPSRFNGNWCSTLFGREVAALASMPESWETRRCVCEELDFYSLHKIWEFTRVVEYSAGDSEPSEKPARAFWLWWHDQLDTMTRHMGDMISSIANLHRACYAAVARRNDCGLLPIVEVLRDVVCPLLDAQQEAVRETALEMHAVDRSASIWALTARFCGDQTSTAFSHAVSELASTHEY
jgi:hypothetical protein